MKPRTAIEREVVELSAKLTPLSKKDIEYAKRNGVEHPCLYTGRRAKCTDCGHIWHESDLKSKVRCPHCCALLTIRETRSKKYNEIEYMLVLQSMKNWQVARFFKIKKECYVEGGSHYQIDEAVQHWFRMNGEHLVIARPRSMGMYLDSYLLHKPMTLKPNVDAACYRLPFYGYICKSVNKVLRRNGFKRDLHGMQPYDLFPLILTKPFAETLFKRGWYDLLWTLDRHSMWNDEMIGAAKIALRNKYDLANKKSDTWVDLVHTLLKLGKDVRNCHYVCPEHLVEAHDKALIEYRRKIKIEADMQRAERIRKNQALADSYEERMGKFFGLLFTDGDIKVRPLKSVAEFEEESKIMHHCVFDNQYYIRENSLILTAMVCDERTETVEVDLKNFRIVQSRGVCNSNTEYHDEIVNLVDANMNKIRKLAI